MPVPKLANLDPRLLSGNPRATLAAWLHYQPLVLQAIRRHPLPFTFSPQGKTSATVVSRMRDAVRGCLAFCYDISDTSISHEDLLRWYAEVIFKYDKDTVSIGTPEKLRASVEALETKSPLHFSSLTFEEVSAFQLLLSTARLQGPITVDSPPDTTLLPIRPNVELLINERNQLVMF